ncbi:MAG: copper resistance system multicopper oxidase [Alphaproteobacteria bacterium]|nr:copper resistance system multicopper oxidase [Alphaproteobacteria bacterium]MDX5415940.1 copper resistance system multicopper oxidase [Alphaproteobacteria bacterium]MDX5493237.1 copper resistance system multicopper oxidase [Alphaproteobacteria bacterium]
MSAYFYQVAAASALLTAAIASAPAAAGEYQLTVSTATIDVDGRSVEKMTINGSIPGPVLRFTEGEKATITVTNETGEKTSVHWHGLLLPGMMDGAPGFNGFMGIAPGESYTYTFDIRQSGTYWYHSHSGTQDQSVLGAIVIDPAAPPSVAADRDYVMLMSDITPEDSDQVLRNLKADPGFYNYSKRTLGDFFRDARRDGLGSALRDRADWGEMRMDPTDLADVTGYSFLVNGKTPQENETFLYSAGEKVRLRFINGSAMTIFDLRIPGAKMMVVAADGNDVHPVTVDELRIGVAERYDVIVEPADGKPLTVFAESLDRSGYARATLATAPGMEAAIPPQRPRALLSMADMGMAHGDHGSHGDHAQQKSDPHEGHMNHDADEHGHHGHDGHHMDHGEGHKMDGHDGHHMDHGPAEHPGHDQHNGHDGHEGHGDHSDHSGHMQHGTKTVAAPAPEARPIGWASGFPSGAKVLAYEDMWRHGAHADNRAPDRTVELRLTGNMERYVWTLNESRFQEATPIRVRYGERVRINFVNETMMAHPMHLHGMFFELENGTGNHRPLKDTVIVPPGKSVSVILTAREVGAWPLHCHLLYHMVSGMMTAFIVEPPETADKGITRDGAIVPLAVSHEAGAAHHGGHAGHGGI